MHYAAKNGHLKIAEYLVSDAHVYVNPAANDNEKRTFVTPLDLAIAHRHADVANFIISKGNLSFKSKLIFTLSTVFENHRKSRIQHCERSELRLHFEWTKVN